MTKFYSDKERKALVFILQATMFSPSDTQAFRCYRRTNDDSINLPDYLFLRAIRFLRTRGQEAAGMLMILGSLSQPPKLTIEEAQAIYNGLSEEAKASIALPMILNS